MDNLDTHDEKRKVHTFFKPELLQILVPLLLAAGSGFLMHDRAISELKTEQELHTTHIKEHNEEIKNLDHTLTELLALRDRISRLELDQRDVQHLATEIDALTSALKQRADFSDGQIKELHARVRKIERDLDKLSK